MPTTTAKRKRQGHTSFDPDCMAEDADYDSDRDADDDTDDDGDDDEQLLPLEAPGESAVRQPHLSPKWPLVGPFHGDDLPTLPVPTPGPPGDAGTLTGVDALMVHQIKGKSGVAQKRLIKDFNTTAAAAAASATRSRDEQLKTVLAGLEARGIVTHEVHDALFGSPAPEADLSAVLSPAMAELDAAFVSAGITTPKFRSITVEVEGNTATMYCRDILECARLLIQAPCCKPGDTFFVTSPPLDPENPVISEQCHAANFRDAEAAVRRAQPPGSAPLMFVGLSMWTDGTPVTKSMQTSVQPVWIWLSNVKGSHRNKVGHSMVVAFIDTMKNKTIRRPGYAKCPEVAASMIKSALNDEMHHVMLRPLKRADSDHHRDGRPYVGKGPGFPPRGGHIPQQLLPGGEGLFVPVTCALTSVIVDGKETVTVLKGLQNWDIGSGLPPELLGRHDIPADATTLRDPEHWESENRRIYDLFLAWFRDTAGCYNQSEFVGMRRRSGLRGGHPGFCGHWLSALRLVLYSEKLHVRDHGVGRQMMTMTEDIWCDELKACILKHLAGLRSPGENLWLPNVGFWGAFLTGEEHRLLHEVYVRTRQSPPPPPPQAVTCMQRSLFVCKHAVLLHGLTRSRDCALSSPGAAVDVVPDMDGASTSLERRVSARSSGCGSVRSMVHGLRSPAH